MDHRTLKVDDDQYQIDNPSHTIEQAFEYFKTLTVSSPHTMRRIDLRDVYNACGSTNGEIVIAALESEAAKPNPVIARALSWAQPGAGMGVDICHSEVQNVFQSLVSIAGNNVTQPMIDQIIALQNETTLKYPGLTLGDVEHVRGGA